ncbi:MAG TPA: hypothetical protein VEH84_04640, partial [Alphaproteobacteria bacterium]|nr:hypothetical protein [Alphaproteobacteria bacterium]
VLFDCHACHHPMSNVKWQARSGTNLPPGVPRINDANLIMLRAILDQVDPSLGKTVRDQTLALHAAGMQGPDAIANAAKALHGTTKTLVKRFADHKFSSADMRGAANALVTEGLSGEYFDYSAAEQATMALHSLVSAMKGSGDVEAKDAGALDSAIEKMYAAVNNDEAYKPEVFTAALKQLQASLPKPKAG